MAEQGTTGSGIRGLWRRRFVVLALSALVVVGVAAPAAQAKSPSLKGSLRINAGALYSSSTSVTLDSVASSGCTQMRVRDAGGRYTAWEPYTTAKPWDVPAGDGLKTVEAQYKGTTGKALTRSATITLDTVGPTTTDDYSGLAGSAFEVTLTPAADASGVALTRYRIDGGEWQDGSVVPLAMKVTRKRGGGMRAGVHAVEYYSIDGVGNEGPVGACQVTLSRVAL